MTTIWYMLPHDLSLLSRLTPDKYIVGIRPFFEGCFSKFGFRPLDQAGECPGGFFGRGRKQLANFNISLHPFRYLVPTLHLCFQSLALSSVNSVKRRLITRGVNSKFLPTLSLTCIRHAQRASSYVAWHRVGRIHYVKKMAAPFQVRAFTAMC